MEYAPGRGGEVAFHGRYEVCHMPSSYLGGMAVGFALDVVVAEECHIPSSYLCGIAVGCVKGIVVVGGAATTLVWGLAHSAAFAHGTAIGDEGCETEIEGEVVVEIEMGL